MPVIPPFLNQMSHRMTALHRARHSVLRCCFHPRAALLLSGFILFSPASPAFQQHPPANIQQHFAAAEKAVQANNFALAEAEYGAVLAADPSNAQAWTGLGVVQYGSGHLDLAAKSLEKALQLNVLDRHAAVFLGLSDADLGRCSKALPLLQSQFTAMPQGKLQRLVGFALLNCLSGQSDTHQALAVVEKLQQVYPSDPDVLYKTAELYTRLWSQAAGALITEHPESYRVHQLAGELYESQGKADLAIREYRAALQENPLPQMHYRIAQLLLHAGGPQVDDKALAELKAELLADSQSFVALYSMAEIERHQHSLAAAEQHYRQAIAINPEFAEARVGLAHLLFDRKAVPEAMAELETALKSDPQNAQAHYVLMMCYRERGELAQASAEQASFRRLEQAKSQNFQSRIDALLGSKEGGSPSVE